MRRDLDDVIQGWPYDPEPGEHLAREVRARDGRMVLQVRIELGVLQLEVERAPRRACARMALSPISITCGIAPPAGDRHPEASRRPGR